DIDADVRSTTGPDIGADEFNGTGGSPIWKGVDTDWENPANWCGVVPTVATNVTIPGGRANYPNITTVTPVANNITISTGGKITISPTGVLSNKGSWTNDGSVTNNGLIVLNGTTNQTFPGTGTGAFPAMFSLTVNNPGGATINKPVTINGTLKPQAGNIAVNDIVTLHSDASGTANVDAVTGSISYGALGKFSVERFISSLTRKAWRFLSAPIGGPQTISQAWQEGQAPGIYVSTGFGMQIVGPAGIPSGFDMANSIPSLKTYDATASLWVSVPNTNVAQISTTEGYMAFIRGDRGSNTFASPNSATTLRTSGPIKTGAVGPLSTATASGFISVGNPYPSAIDFTLTTRNGLLNTYYLWDPKLGTYGGYQTFNGPSYTATPGGGSYAGGNKFIESGMAFFVVATAAAVPHNISFAENNKVSGSFQVARPGVAGKQLRTQLSGVSGADPNLIDGILVEFDPAYSNDVDELDAPKLSNFGENIGILSHGKSISVERHASIVDRDTLFYQLGQLRQQNYQLDFIVDNLAAGGFTAYLEDAYLLTSTVIALDGNTTVNFTVNADAASKASNRFRIVFRQLGPVPVTFTNIRADRQDKKVLVSWKVENELSIDHYSVERSADGRNFRELGTKIATDNSGGTTVQYSWLDEQPLTGDNFYRIKSVGAGNDVKISETVNVNMKAEPSLITAYPNPVTEDGLLKVRFTNTTKGNYRLSLINGKGQVLMSRMVNHEGGSSVYDFNLNHSVAHGSYVLQVSKGNKVKATFKIVY
ncbi:MAG: T9SS type A sorting domain-containing protein, partial [Ferruginibacter sp.]|nr:T9SS type A sorting domain-containing protein [Ferruginibacter sp.]